MKIDSTAKILCSLGLFALVFGVSAASAQGNNGQGGQGSNLGAIVRVQNGWGLILAEGLLAQSPGERQDVDRLLHQGQLIIGGVDTGDDVVVDGQVVAAARRHCGALASQHELVETVDGSMLYTSDGQAFALPGIFGRGVLINEFWLLNGTRPPPSLSELPSPPHAGIKGLSAPDVIARHRPDWLSAPDVIAIGRPDEVACRADIDDGVVPGEFIPREVSWRWSNEGAFVNLDLMTGLATIDHGPGPADP